MMVTPEENICQFDDLLFRRYTQLDESKVSQVCSFFDPPFAFILPIRPIVDLRLVSPFVIPILGFSMLTGQSEDV
jgi:hypothetical protein